MMTRWADGAGRIAWVLWAAFGAGCTASEGDTGPVTLPSPFPRPLMFAYDWG